MSIAIQDVLSRVAATLPIEAVATVRIYLGRRQKIAQCAHRLGCSPRLVRKHLQMVDEALAQFGERVPRHHYQGRPAKGRRSRSDRRRFKHAIET